MFTTSSRTLIVLSAVLWYSGGVVLVVKGGSHYLEAVTLNPAQDWTWLAVTAGLLIGWLKAKYLFSRSCEKNLVRINLLNDPKPWQFFRPGFLLFLMAMIVLGTTLSRLAHGNYPFLIGMVIVDFSLATALFGSSYVFWKKEELGK